MKGDAGATEERSLGGVSYLGLRRATSHVSKGLFHLCVHKNRAGGGGQELGQQRRSPGRVSVSLIHACAKWGGSVPLSCLPLESTKDLSREEPEGRSG